MFDQFIVFLSTRLMDRVAITFILICPGSLTKSVANAMWETSDHFRATAIEQLFEHLSTSSYRKMLQIFQKTSASAWKLFCVAFEKTTSSSDDDAEVSKYMPDEGKTLKREPWKYCPILLQDVCQSALISEFQTAEFNINGILPKTGWYGIEIPKNENNEKTSFEVFTSESTSAERTRTCVHLLKRNAWG